jgi:hypothetical protein
MKERVMSEKEILAAISRLEGVIFAGPVTPGIGALSDCGKCGCDSRTNDRCGCFPRCTCDGKEASHWDIWDQVINPVVLLANALSTDDVKKLAEMRERLIEFRKSAGEGSASPIR